MLRALCLPVALALGVASAPLTAAQAFTFHCRGDACRAVTFLDEGNGCTVVTSRSNRTIHVRLGPYTYDLAPGETYAPLLGVKCGGYYSDGETATFE